MARKFKTTVLLDNNFIKQLKPGVEGTDAVNKNQLDAVASATGESNNGLNIGDGAAVYAGKTGLTLEFRTIKGGSLKVITSTLGNHVLIDVIEGQINHNALLNYRPEEHRTINDQGIGSTDLWSAQQIVNYIQANNGGGSSNPLNNEGGYNPNTNTPDVLSGTNIEANDFYIINESGTFYGEPVEPGYWIIAQTNNPTTAADWDIVPFNVAAVAQATTEQAGIIEIATLAEALDGTSTNTAITPETLHATILDFSFVSKAVFQNVAVGDANTPANLVHNLKTLDVMVQVYSPQDGEDREITWKRIDINTIQVSADGSTENVNVIVIG